MKTKNTQTEDKAISMKIKKIRKRFVKEIRKINPLEPIGDKLKAKQLNAKLNLLFSELRKAGYSAKQNWTCCQTCGWSELPEVPSKKYAFYHMQDAEGIVNNTCYLCWDCPDGNEILTLAHKVGLQTEWDGSEKTRIRVFV